MRLHPRVIKIIFRRADELGVTPACIVEMMARETNTDELADFRPGVRVNNKTYSEKGQEQ